MPYRRHYRRGHQSVRHSYWRPGEPFIKYRCDKCGKVNSGQESRHPRNWFTVPDLYDPGKRTGTKSFRIQGLYCDKCRKDWSRTPIEISKGIAVTRNISERLTMQARQEIHAEHHGVLGHDATIWWIVGLFSFGIGLLIATNGPAVLGGLIAALGAIIFAVGVILGVAYYPDKEKMLKELSEQRTLKLARQRRDQIEDREAFYGSAEWRALRLLVIEEQGRVCRSCGRSIKLDVDVTVDHIRPRSIYPDLSLAKSNLQVLCRACNSRKGATE